MASRYAVRDPLGKLKASFAGSYNRRNSPQRHRIFYPFDCGGARGSKTRERGSGASAVHAARGLFETEGNHPISGTGTTESCDSGAFGWLPSRRTTYGW